jgi:hypothetical protein
MIGQGGGDFPHVEEIKFIGDDGSPAGCSKSNHKSLSYLCELNYGIKKEETPQTRALA